VVSTVGTIDSKTNKAIDLYRDYAEKDIVFIIIVSASCGLFSPCTRGSLKYSKCARLYPSVLFKQESCSRNGNNYEIVMQSH